MEELRIIIAGGRDFENYFLLKTTVIEKISEKNPFPYEAVIVSGMARGADKLGVQFANELGLKLYRFPAEWERLGKRAGYARNVEMAKFASEGNNKGMLIAFWDGKSKGTKHMIDTAKRYGIEVHIVNYSK